MLCWGSSVRGNKEVEVFLIFMISQLTFKINPSSPEHFSQTYFPKGGLLQPPSTIINMEGHVTLNLLPLYSYGCLSIETNK